MVALVSIGRGLPCLGGQGRPSPNSRRATLSQLQMREALDPHLTWARFDIGQGLPSSDLQLRQGPPLPKFNFPPPWPTEGRKKKKKEEQKNEKKKTKVPLAIEFEVNVLVFYFTKKLG